MSANDDVDFPFFNFLKCFLFFFGRFESVDIIYCYRKIFQPFFTTKPTGKGTGLGMSLAYDIITKAHEGTLTLQSAENVENTFLISLAIWSLYLNRKR